MLMNDPQHPYRASLYHMFFNWQRKMALWCLLSATVTASLYWFNIIPNWAAFPSFPLAVVGGTLGIFVSFRTNSAYQRWWEGRKLWGRLINTSRHLSTQALTYLPEADAKTVIHRHAAYVHALRCALRNEAPHEDEHYIRCCDPSELERFKDATNLNHALLTQQMRQFIALKHANTINDFWMSDLDESIRHLLDIQGGTERIKKTPFPPAYGYLAIKLTQIYAVVLPICIVDQIGWWVIPTNLAICMAFQLINEVGRALENPFTSFWPALPLSAMSLTIERNIRQIRGETDLPPGQQPLQHKGITVLM